MESNNIVIKMYLFYMQDKFTENNSRRPHCALVEHALGVIVNRERCSGISHKDNFYFAKNGLDNLTLADFPCGE